MAQWWYVTDEGTSAEVSEADLSRMYQSGTVGADTLVWKAGSADWAPLGEVFPKPADRVVPPPVPPRASSVSPHPKGEDAVTPPRGPQSPDRPGQAGIPGVKGGEVVLAGRWRRWIARLVDTSVFGLPAGVALAGVTSVYVPPIAVGDAGKP